MIKLHWLKYSCCFGFLLSCFMLTGPAFASDEVVDIYQQQVPKMTTIECAKCHMSVFTDLRDHGGLHKQQCSDCHEKFHSFTPGIPWEERVPACNDCHDNPHGEEFVDCKGCHQDGHMPLASLIAAAELAEQCVSCHQQAAADLLLEDNSHGGQECSDCHQSEKHGERPQCNSCHDDSHAEYVDNSGCVTCHPYHQPNKIAYGTEIPSEICAGCHSDQQQELLESEKKHKLLACVICHAEEHGNVTGCSDCHGNGPHNPELLKNFTSCNDCHGSPHGLKL